MRLAPISMDSQIALHNITCTTHLYVLPDLDAHIDAEPLLQDFTPTRWTYLISYLSVFVMHALRIWAGTAWTIRGQEGDSFAVMWAILLYGFYKKSADIGPGRRPYHVSASLYRRFSDGAIPSSQNITDHTVTSSPRSSAKYVICKDAPGAVIHFQNSLCTNFCRMTADRRCICQAGETSHGTRWVAAGGDVGLVHARHCSTRHAPRVCERVGTFPNR